MYFNLPVAVVNFLGNLPSHAQIQIRWHAGTNFDGHSDWLID